VGDAIGGIQKGTHDNIAQLSETVTAIEGVTGKAQEAGAALQAIVSLSDSVSTQVASIAAASEEGSAVSEQINRAVNEVRDISSEIRTGMQASSEDVGNLTAQTQSLRDVIAQLQKAMA
jgi:methyl-accepting chemotaxis protein